MKIYTFLDSDGKIIGQVRAENHALAMARLNTTLSEKNMVNSNTDFYSENISNFSIFI